MLFKVILSSQKDVLKCVDVTAVRKIKLEDFSVRLKYVLIRRCKILSHFSMNYPEVSLTQVKT